MKEVLQSVILLGIDDPWASEFVERLICETERHINKVQKKKDTEISELKAQLDKIVEERDFYQAQYSTLMNKDIERRD